MKNIFIVLCGIELSACIMALAPSSGSREDEIERELVHEIEMVHQKILEMSAHIMQVTGSKYPLSDEAFCKIDPDSADTEHREYIESALLMKAGNEQFPCLTGLDRYSKYFNASNRFLYWASLANNNGEFYGQFVKSNDMCELIRLYPESLEFLRIRGYTGLSNKIVIQWKNCPGG